MTEREMVRAILEHTEYLRRNHLPYEGFEIMQTKWCARILLELCQRTPQRFGELKRAMPEISNVVLSSALKTLVERGMGCALTLESRHVTGGTLCFRPFLPTLESGSSLVWKKYQLFSRAAALFLERIHEKFRESE